MVNVRTLPRQEHGAWIRRLSPRDTNFSMCLSPGAPARVTAACVRHGARQAVLGQRFRQSGPLPGTSCGRAAVRCPGAGTKKAKPRQRSFAWCGRRRRKGSEVGPEKGLDPVKGDDVHPVVQIRVRGPGHDQQFLVVPVEFFEGICWQAQRRKSFLSIYLGLHRIEYQSVTAIQPCFLMRRDSLRGPSPPVKIVAGGGSGRGFL